MCTYTYTHSGTHHDTVIPSEPLIFLSFRLPVPALLPRATGVLPALITSHPGFPITFTLIEIYHPQHPHHHHHTLLTLACTTPTTLSLLPVQYYPHYHKTPLNHSCSYQPRKYLAFSVCNCEVFIHNSPKLQMTIGDPQSTANLY